MKRLGRIISLTLVILAAFFFFWGFSCCVKHLPKKVQNLGFSVRGVLLFCLLATAPVFGSQFELLMGKDSPAWIHVSKEEDVWALQRFEKLFNKNYSVEAQEGLRIPKTIHCVWLRDEPIPHENLLSWIEMHPDWQCHLWTTDLFDQPDRRVAFHLVEDFPFLYAKERFDVAASAEEKEEILESEILYQLGGIAVDLQTRCQKRFDSLSTSYNFFCCLNSPHPPLNGRNISTSLNVVGASAFHPVVGDVLRERHSWIDALLDHVEEDGNRDIVFPAQFATEEGYLVVPVSQEEPVAYAEDNPHFRSLTKEVLSLNVLAALGGLVYFARKRRRRRG